VSIRHCKLDKKQQIRLLEFFILEVTARAAADLLGIQLNTTTLFYRKVRIIIAEKLEIGAAEEFGGEVALDERYFSGIRYDKIDHDVAEKVPMFGILVRRGTVFTQMINATKTNTLMPVVQQKVEPAGIVYTDDDLATNALDCSKPKYFKINSSKLLVNKSKHSKSIEHFWNKSKHILLKYNGVLTEHFYLFLKECEFRFNHGSYKQQFNTLKKWCDL